GHFFWRSVATACPAACPAPAMTTLFFAIACRLHRADAAVDADLGTGHECRFVGSKVEDGVSHVIRPAHAAQRDLARQFLEGYRAILSESDPVEYGRVDEYRMYRVATDSVAGLRAVQGDRLA